MLRLSIVIPFRGSVESFEDTLASVLQNRPDDCEVVAVHRGDYGDPYELAGEVRFVEAAKDAGPIEVINHGLAASRGGILHLLGSGVRVEDGWTAAAMKRFADDRIGAVAPLVLDAGDSQRVVSAGVCYSAGGNRSILGGGRKLEHARRLAGRRIAGPTLDAAFFRRFALESIGGLRASAGLELADVDLGLSLRALGKSSVVEPDSSVRANGAGEAWPLTFQSGLAAERLFWRHAGTIGWLPSLAAHPLAVVKVLLSQGKRGGAMSHLFGRFAAIGDLLRPREKQPRLHHTPRDPDERDSTASIPMRPRIAEFDSADEDAAAPRAEAFSERRQMRRAA